MSPAYPPAQRALELFGIAAFVAFAAREVPRMAGSPGELVAAALLAWLAADLASGLVHWALDRFGSPATPLVGAILIRPFREHHADALAMTRHDFVETNGAAALGGAVLLAAAMAMAPGAAHAFVVFAATGALAANQCHKWAHMADRPGWVRAAQRARLILAPEAHRRHHAAPFDRSFCTASGWMNAFLDSILRKK